MRIVHRGRREARDGGASYLIPITLDNYLFNWKDLLAIPIRDRVVADFRGAKTKDERFEIGFLQLLLALKITE